MDAFTDHNNREQVLRDLAITLSATGSTDLFDKVSLHLAKVLGVSHVLIGQVLEDNKRTRVVAGVYKGRPLDLPLEYDLEGSPCEVVLKRGFCVYPTSVQELFPQDIMLMEMGVESYIGAPLISRNGELLGLIAVLDSKPAQNIDLAESLLTIFSSRLEAEFESFLFQQKQNTSNYRLTLLTDFLPNGVVENNLDGLVSYANTAAHRIFGFKPGEMVGKYIWDFEKNETRRAEIRDYYFKVIKELPGSKPINIETRTQDGREMTLEAIWNYQTNSNGDLQGLVFVISDVTVRANAQRACKESERRLNLILNTMPYGVQETDSRGVITFANEAQHRMMGYESGELIGQHVWDHRATEESRQAVKTEYAHLIAKQPEPAMGIATNITKDGREIKIEYKWDYQRDPAGNVTGFVSVNSDITEALLTQTALNESEEKFSKAFYFHPIAMQILNLENGERLEINEKCLALYGVKNRTELNKSIFQNNQWVHSSKQSESVKQLMREGSLKNYPIEILLNGKTKHLISNASMLDILDGKYAIISYIDVTENKQLETKLNEYYQHLEERVKERTVQLADARERAEAANRAKSSFLANMSHEIRTPINAIMGLTHLLHRAEPTPEQLQQLFKIDNSAGHLLSIINDILDLSKIDAG